MDIENLLKSLKDHKVRFVIIGAAAFPVHGYTRSTLDIDIAIEPTPANAKRTLQALKSFGYDVSDTSVQELLEKKVLIRQYLVETDIHPFVTGIQWPRLWKNRVTRRYGKHQVHFASLKDLIRMKKAAGRPKDRQDLRELRALTK